MFPKNVLTEKYGKTIPTFCPLHLLVSEIGQHYSQGFGLEPSPAALI